MKGSLRSFVRSCAIVAVLGLLAGGVLAQEGVTPVEKEKPPSEKTKPAIAEVLKKQAPASVAELRAIQEQVKAVLKKVVPATVGIQIGGAAGSGVIIDAEGHVLTAGHVSGEPNRNCTLILPDGRRLKGKTLGANSAVDSGLIKITDKGKWDFVEMGDSTKLKPGHWCIAVGHPGGVKKGRSPVVRVGRVLLSARSLIQTDCTLVGGDSGGPLFDLDGKVIGIHSRIGPAITANIHVPVSSYRSSWDRLVKGERWNGRTPRGATKVHLGIGFALETDDLEIAEVYGSSPAEKAGLKPGDVILSIDGKKMSKRPELAAFLQTKKPGDEVTVEVQRDKMPVKLQVTLAKRPE